MRVVAIVVAFVALGSGVTYAATGWRVLAKGEGDGQYSSYASASVDVTKPLALRIRASGRQLQLSGYFSCQLPDRNVQSGQTILLTVAGAKSCSVSASAIASDGGRVRVFIEGRKR
jgi:hypothetical protein